MSVHALSGGGLVHVVERKPTDGPLAVIRISHDTIRIECDEEYFVVSEFNARRMLASLSIVLGLPLTKAAQKVIKL